MLLEGLFPPAVRTAEIDISGHVARFFPEEAISLAGAVEHRRREFSAGRTCARQAMRGLGREAAAVPIGTDRAPVWPSDLVGSISHNETRCGAALALKANGIRSIGLDIEAAEPLDDALAEEICTPREMLWLESQSQAERGLLRKAIFSAKECTYKCQYPLSHTLFGFDSIEIDLDIAAGQFQATFVNGIPPFRLGERLVGRIRLTDGHIVTAMVID